MRDDEVEVHSSTSFFRPSPHLSSLYHREPRQTESVQTRTEGQQSQQYSEHMLVTCDKERTSRSFVALAARVESVGTLRCKYGWNTLIRRVILGAAKSVTRIAPCAMTLVQEPLHSKQFTCTFPSKRDRCLRFISYMHLPGHQSCMRRTVKWCMALKRGSVDKGESCHEMLQQQTDVALDEVPTDWALMEMLYLEQAAMGTADWPLLERDGAPFKRPKERARYNTGPTRRLIAELVSQTSFRRGFKCDL
jgi:hypothetical protein